jgi:Methylamine utilisation protein MauE
VISTLAVTLRFAVAIVLAVAALAKARSFGAFRQTVDAVTPWRKGVSGTATAVVVTEATLAALLAAGVLASVVAAATLTLFLGFAAASLWAARRGLRVRCNCFGSSDRELGKDSLATSLLLAGATVVYWTLLRRVEPSLSLAEIPLAATLGVAAVLAGRWLLAASELAEIVRQRRRLDSDLADATRGIAR